MLTLNPNESRVLGVLVEKAQTTPQQYPLTLNALTNGCNQKNNREPVTNLSEEQVMQSLDTLRGKNLVREVMLTGSRVQKFRHIARETLEIDTNQLVILTELLLRGPQTIGELRGRASRMATTIGESTEIVKNILDSLMQRGEGKPAMVRELPPAPGDRAARFMQLLCPNLHPLNAPPSAQTPSTSSARQPSPSPDDALTQRISALEREVAELRAAIERISTALGESGTK